MMNLSDRNLQRTPRNPNTPYFGHALNGDPLLLTDDRARRLGYQMAEDTRGFEYIRGLDEQLQKHGQGGATLWRTLNGTQEIWHRDPLNHTWTRDESASVAKATAAPIRGRAWTLPSGEPFDRRSGRGDAINACREWIESVRNGTARNLWIHGLPGRGKSQLAAWIAADLAITGTRAEQWTLPDLAKIMRASWNDENVRKEWQEVDRRICTAPLLILDDVSACGETPSLREFLFTLFERRLHDALPTVCTDNQSPEALEKAGFDPRLVSRLGAGLVIELKGPNFRNDNSKR